MEGSCVHMRGRNREPESMEVWILFCMDMCCDVFTLGYSERGVSRDQHLWREVGRSRTGQRENLNCDAGLTKPWPTWWLALEKAFSFRASHTTQNCLLTLDLASLSHLMQAALRLGSKPFQGGSGWHISVATTVWTCVCFWPHGLLSLNQFHSFFFKASCLFSPLPC